MSMHGINRNSIDREEFYGCTAPVNRNGFKFVSGHQRYIYNDLVVFSPDSARAGAGNYRILYILKNIRKDAVYVFSKADRSG